ncbi:murein transglycosylase [Amycolatopsis ultiminotia]|uniref:Murein transglycosylase n=1 Tax=Amycolatopsis ultiminotia TaxID=543629 RepID=A0ABP6Y5D9_9PSEU
MADTTQQTAAESSPAGPPRRYRGRIAMSLGLVLTGVVLVVTIGVRDPDPPAPAAAPAPPPSSVGPEQAPKPGAQAPRTGLAAPPDRPTVSDQAELDTWAARVAGKTGLSPRLVSAYGRAEMWMSRQKPTCHLSWATLAAIGHLSSDAMQIGPDGVVSGPSTGPSAGPDTDGGALDGDRAADHKLGPLQLAPSTWRKYAQRANGDGKPANPRNIDDAAFTAARYLCSGADDLGTPAGWWRAMLFYNASVQYGQNAFVAADSYAADSVAP